MNHQSQNHGANIAFIGGGNMASAIIGGLIRGGTAPNQLQVVEPVAAQAEMLQTVHGIEQVFGHLSAVKPAQIVLLAVKPQVMQEVCMNLRMLTWLPESLIVSIAAGTTLKKLNQWLGGHTKIVRTMPNTPALIGQGITGLVATEQVSKSEREVAEQLLRATGSTIWFERESDLDTVTAVSGSGPAYVFAFLEAMEAAGIAEGLTAPQAKLLAKQTVLGAAQLAAQSEDHFSTLRERVTSKGGTTAAALQVLTEKGFQSTLMQAIHAARKRSEELGNA